MRRNDIEDDQIGIYKPQAESAAWSAKQHPDELVFEAVNKAFTAKCYDGQPMISGSHKVGKLTFSNKGTKKLSIASLAAAQASYGVARTTMMKFKDESGRPLNVKPNILLVPPAQEDVANALMTVDRLEDGKPNPYKGTAKVQVSARLTDDNAWFLVDNTKPVKPFVYQVRKSQCLFHKPIWTLHLYLWKVFSTLVLNHVVLRAMVSGKPYTAQLVRRHKPCMQRQTR